MSEKEVKKSRKTLIALLIVVVVLAASLGGVFYYFTTLVNEKDSTISSLSKERDTLRTQISSLQTQISSLQSQISSLQSQISSLQAQISSLEGERDNLRSQLSSLQSRVSELEDIVNLRKTTTLEKDKTINLVAGGDITLSYSTPYAGYVTVTFTASGPVYFWVGSSFTGGEYYMRYPVPLRGSFDTATSGSFTAPVYPGTTYLYIRHPALLIGATVTFTVTYTY
jgi:chaperonin cofactor prefoldin